MPCRLFSISAVLSSSDHAGRVRERDGEQLLDGRYAGRPASSSCRARDVDLVVVQRVQRRRGRRRHPGTRRAGLRVADLLLEHRGHLVRHRPHALADLGPAVQPAREPDVDVLVLVGLDPLRRLHVALADHRAAQHRGVQLVAGAVEEPGVDERDPPPRRVDAGLEVGRRTPLLVHDPELDGAPAAARAGPRRAANRSSVNATSSGPCIFGFTAYIEPVRELTSSLRPWMSTRLHERGHDRVEDALGDLGAVRSRIASVVIRWPTWRTKSSERPGSTIWPSGPS